MKLTPRCSQNTVGVGELSGMGALPSQGLSAKLGKFSDSQVRSRHRSGAVRDLALPLRTEAGPGALAPVNGSTYLLELLVDDLVNLV